MYSVFQPHPNLDICVQLCSVVPMDFTNPFRKDRTVTRTMRVDEGIDDVLRSEAQRKGVSVNTLLDQWLTRYVESFRFFELLRHDFNGLSRERRFESVDGTVCGSAFNILASRLIQSVASGIIAPASCSPFRRGGRIRRMRRRVPFDRRSRLSNIVGGDPKNERSFGRDHSFQYAGFQAESRLSL